MINSPAAIAVIVLFIVPPLMGTNRLVIRVF